MRKWTLYFFLPNEPRGSVTIFQLLRAASLQDAVHTGIDILHTFQSGYPEKVTLLRYWKSRFKGSSQWTQSFSTCHATVDTLVLWTPQDAVVFSIRGRGNPALHVQVKAANGKQAPWGTGGARGRKVDREDEIRGLIHAAYSLPMCRNLRGRDSEVDERCQLKRYRNKSKQSRCWLRPLKVLTEINSQKKKKVPNGEKIDKKKTSKGKTSAKKTKCQAEEEAQKM